MPRGIKSNPTHPVCNRVPYAHRYPIPKDAASISKPKLFPPRLSLPQHPQRPLHPLQPIPLPHHHPPRQRLNCPPPHQRMQIVPTGQLARDSLPRIHQLTARIPKLTSRCFSFLSSLSATLIQQSERPAVRAVGGGSVPLDGLLKGGELRDEGMRAREGGEDGGDGGVEGEEFGLEGL